MGTSLCLIFGYSAIRMTAYQCIFPIGELMKVLTQRTNQWMTYGYPLLSYSR